MDTIIKRVSTGVEGFDEILQGGFIPQSTNLVRGGPGAGKTTLGLHFLIEGAKNNESVIYITLGEPEAKIRRNAEIQHLDLSGVRFLDLSPQPDFFSKVESYDIFSPADVEREPTTKKIVDEISSLKPSRVFLDSMTQFKFLSTDNFQFHKQALSFLHFLQESQATILFTTESSQLAPDDDLQFISDCVVNLEHNANGRQLRVNKCRGSDFLNGDHAFKIADRGITVFPNLVPDIKVKGLAEKNLSTGVAEIDKILHTGIEIGTINLLSGHSGVGKTTLALQMACTVAASGFNTAIYSFEEEIEMMLLRADSLNIPLRKYVQEKKILMVKTEPLLYTADEFALIVRQHAEEFNLSLIIIDSIAGYKLSIKDIDLVSKLHAFCKFFQSSGLTTFLLYEVQNITGDFKVSEEGISYLADNIIFIRYLELKGEMKKAIGVLKKRLSDFEKTLREFKITKDGIVVGEPLTNLRGILSGTPTFIDSNDE